jgi:hypothetical protein
MPLAPGQGKPLPESLKCAGEWVIEDHVFLYFPDGQLATGPRFTRGASREDGRSCIGFDVEQLATAFDLDVPSILAANREGTLVCRGTAKTPPTHGGSSATTYAFQIGERNAYLKVEINTNEGTA